MWIGVALGVVGTVSGMSAVAPSQTTKSLDSTLVATHMGDAETTNITIRNPRIRKMT
jgi:hypothetical protein